jgi:antirestriction protein ArdC
VLQPIVAAQNIVDNMANRPALSIVESDSAFYTPALDSVTLPLMSQFTSAEGFYATAFHELAHATGHVSRLNREGVMDGKGVGSQRYSKEELVAEMTSAFLCAECDILPSVEQNSIAYVQSWASALNKDPRMIVEAAGMAQKAADYILGTTFTKEADDE